jgi:plasmid maintenance system antidote protein VapI
MVSGSAESWLHMQEAVDLWEVERKFKQNPALAPTALPLLAIAA